MRNRNRTTLWVGLLALIVGATDASAQVSSVSLQYHFLADSNLKNPIPGIEASNDVKFAIGSVDFAARLPFFGTFQGAEAPTNPTRAAGVYLSFQRKFVEEFLFTRESDDLYAFGGQLRYFAALSNNWGWAAMGGAKLPVSVVEKAQPRDLTYQFAGAIRYSTWENGTIGLGFLYSQDIGESFILPIVHTDLYWFNGKLNLAMGPWDPIQPRASIRYRPSPIWSIGIGAVLTGDQYALTDASVNLRDENGNIIVENVNAGLSMADVIVGPEFLVHSGALDIDFIGGIALYRRFDFRAIDEDELLRIELDDGSKWVPAEFDLENIGTLMVRGQFRF